MPDTVDPKRQLHGQVSGTPNLNEFSKGHGTQRDFPGEVTSPPLSSSTAQPRQLSSQQSTSGDDPPQSLRKDRPLTVNQRRLGQNWRQDAALASARYSNSNFNEPDQNKSFNPSTQKTEPSQADLTVPTVQFTPPRRNSIVELPPTRQPIQPQSPPSKQTSNQTVSQRQNRQQNVVSSSGSNSQTINNHRQRSRPLSTTNPSVRQSIQPSVTGFSGHHRPQRKPMTELNPTPHGKGRASSPPPPQSRVFQPLLYSVRLLVLGVGVSVIGGTFLSIWQPDSSPALLRVMSTHQDLSQPLVNQVSSSNPSQSNTTIPPLKIATQEIPGLKKQIQDLLTLYPELGAEVFLMDMDNGEYVDMNGSAPISAASTIKVPILVALFQDVDQGKIQLDELLSLRSDLVVGESGQMQFKPIGSRFTALETAVQMIVSSDNTATQLLIDRMGGMKSLNERFRNWGLKSTALHSPLPDTSGTNITSPKDLGTLLTLVGQGHLLSLRSRDFLLTIMQRTLNRSLIPSGVGEGAIVANKTGNISTLLGDVAFVDLPNGRRYVISVLIKRPPDNQEATNLIVQTSKLAFQHFTKNRPLLTKSAIVQPQPIPTSFP